MSDASAPANPSVGDETITLNVFGRTDVGQIREHNEDNFLIADLSRQSRSLLEADRTQAVGPRGNVLGVCDGMGGAAAGEVASQLAVDIIYEMLCAEPPPNGHDELARRLVHAVEEAGVRIFNEARADRSRRGMGTTATIATLLDERLFLAQVGDSRAYILRNGQMVQVTRDQSLVTQLIEAGQLTEEEAETFEHNNIILQALGTADSVQVDLTYVDLRQGDRLMLCSDGLSGMIRSDEIRQVLMTFADPLHACKELTDRANAAGGHDNITVIVADFVGPGLPPLGRADDTLCYRKYSLPELSSLASTSTLRAGPDGSAPSGGVEASAPPPEPKRDSLRMRVANTILGGSVRPPEGAAPPTGNSVPAPSSMRLYDPTQDPISIPVSGLPPTVVGALVILAMLVAAVAGFFLIH
ncbi:MAG TPA: Stp1/IreP family PP2C-type Ser/Thr phosphatase [Polyangiaceae bacterium]|nr:Stp1/IreP family PP2C-type Ser/Thr phosphatase [Polyangiaceae bacterium]